MAVRQNTVAHIHEQTIDEAIPSDVDRQLLLVILSRIARQKILHVMEIDFYACIRKNLCHDFFQHGLQLRVAIRDFTQLDTLHFFTQEVRESKLSDSFGAHFKLAGCTQAKKLVELLSHVSPQGRQRIDFAEFEKIDLPLRFCERHGKDTAIITTLDRMTNNLIRVAFYSFGERIFHRADFAVRRRLFHFCVLLFGYAKRFDCRIYDIGFLLLNCGTDCLHKTCDLRGDGSQRLRYDFFCHFVSPFLSHWFTGRNRLSSTATRRLRFLCHDHKRSNITLLLSQLSHGISRKIRAYNLSHSLTFLSNAMSDLPVR